MAKVELTPAKLAELKQKAEAAENCAPSPWVFRDMPAVKGEVRDSENFQVAGWFCLRWQADYIAAADPATVLAMVEEIEQLRRMERKWGQMLKNVKDTAPDLETFFSPDAFKLKESEATP